jgi:hypothetical protein
MSNGSPTPAQVVQVQTNLKHMQKLNDYVYNQGQSKVSNAYLLLSETDAADPGMTVAVDILRGAFLALGKLLPVGGGAATFMAGMVADWGTNTPPNLNTTFASLLTRLQASSLAVDRQLATYHQDVAGNWGTQFTDNGQTTTLADLASVSIPPETDPQFATLAEAALVGLDRQVWKTVLAANYVITHWKSSSGDLNLGGVQSSPPVQYDTRFIAAHPAYYNTFAWYQKQGACDDPSGWIVSEYNLGTGAGVLHDGSMSAAACAYLFVDSSDGVVINADGLFARKTVFDDLGITQTTYTVDDAPIGAMALSRGYLRAMRSGKTIGRLVEHEGREAVEQRIVERAHEDPVFAASLRHRPRQTLEAFLGVKIPETVTIRAVLETPRSFTIVVPPPPQEREV